MTRNFQLLAITALLLCGTVAAIAENGDDTLRYFLAKSDLVVSGTISSNLIVITADPNMPIYSFDFRVDDVLKGDLGLKGKLIPVSIGRIEAKPHTLLKGGGKCTLFLRRAIPPKEPAWQEADLWFSVQPADASLSGSLKRLANGK